MEPEKHREKKWRSNAVAACIAVAFYVLLTHLDAVLEGLSSFVGNFKAVILGCVLAYLMNPLACWYQRKLRKKARPGALPWTLCVVLAVVTGLLFLMALLGLLIPQLTESVRTLADNFDDYAASLRTMLDNSGLPLSGTVLDPEQWAGLSENMMETISGFVKGNANRILGAAASMGRGVFTWAVALILSVYLLAGKDSAKAGAARLLRALLRPKRAKAVTEFFRRCDFILVHFVVDSLMESLIVGALNGIFMLSCRMQYAGLISVVVGVTNLIPTFGPIIGGVVGAFILLLVNPLHALIFVLFTFALQFVDGYVVKPKLFGNSLGVSGLLILVSGIVGGNLFGFTGVLLAIPSAAILNFAYHDYLLPALEGRK
ncbi:MAG: AI-2E family transporter [Oscillibacter sp.]|nr:AI-2E family transporter [Oscillibacter sp.]